MNTQERLKELNDQFVYNTKSMQAVRCLQAMNYEIRRAEIAEEMIATQNKDSEMPIWVPCRTGKRATAPFKKNKHSGK